MKVKILFKKRDTALIEFEDDQQASLAKKYLNDIPFFNSVLNVNDSKITAVNTTYTNYQEAQLSHDYTQSKEHRYKIVGSRNTQNIAVKLYVVNII